MKSLQQLTAIILLLLSSSLFAADYYWTVPYPDTRPAPRYESAQAACDANHEYYVQNRGAHITRSQQMPMVSKSPTVFGCVTHNYNINAQGVERHIQTVGNDAVRMGDSCPENTTYNPETGACESPEPDPCEAKLGQTQSFSRSGTAPDPFAFVVAGRFVYEDTACVQGCLVTTHDKVCTGRVDGSYSCGGTAEFTGAQCGNTTTPVTPSETSEPPVPEKNTETTPCIYTTTPDGKQTCTSTQIEDTEGQNCGTVNGVPKCVDKLPTRNELEVTTTIDTQTNPDGTTQTTKTDKADVTTCTGVGSCTTTTTTSTTIINRKPDGTVTSQSGTCVGPHCPDRNTNPDSNGDGFGDCLFGCSDGEGDGGSFGGPSFDDVPSFGDSLTDFMDRVAASPLLTSIDGIRLQGSGSCSFPSVNTDIGVISVDFMCQNANWLDPLYYIFLAIWALAAVRVLMSA